MELPPLRYTLPPFPVSFLQMTDSETAKNRLVTPQSPEAQNRLHSQAQVQVLVKPGREKPLRERHPWVHARSIVPPSTPLNCGSVVDLVDQAGRWLGRGLYHPESGIAVRVYTFDPKQQLDEAFFIRRLTESISRRDPQRVDARNEGIRLVFSEADGLSGLIVDRYGPYLVIQVTSGAIVPFLPSLVGWLHDRFKPAGVIQRVDRQVAQTEGLGEADELLLGTLPTELIVEEHGLRYRVNLASSQKTGLYLDQRENRLLAARYCRGKVLDVCCYVGGFALTVAKHGQATEIVGLDCSGWAIDTARQNAIDNQAATRSIPVRFEVADCFDFLAARFQAGERFDSVILDPPRFAGTREGIPAALRAYERLNLAAVRILNPGGRLVTCSCSGRVSRADFQKILGAVCRRSGREFTVLENRGAASDHPTRISVPQSEYLKCIVLEVS